MSASPSPHPDLLTSREIAIKPDFLQPEEQCALLDWAVPLRPLLNSNGPGRTFRKVPQLPSHPPLYEQVRLRLQDWLCLPADIAPEPMFGWYLSIISEGGGVHRHKDPTQPGRRHLRCNLFLQLPEQGGLPMIEGEVMPVTERGILAFFPSEKFHGSQSVQGSRWRVICSFGYLVPDDYKLPADNLASYFE